MTFAARDQLANAHRRMTSAEIAEHALQLASEIEELRARVDTLVRGNNKAGILVTSLQETLQLHLENMHRIQALFEAHRKREARELLHQAASIVFEPEAIPLIEPVSWSDRIFSPVPGAQL